MFYEFYNQGEGVLTIAKGFVIEEGGGERVGNYWGWNWEKCKSAFCQNVIKLVESNIQNNVRLNKSLTEKV